MKVCLKVEVTVEVGKGSSKNFAAYFIKKTVDFNNVPIPFVGDQIYIDGFFLDVTGRCITPQVSDVAKDDAPIEIFSSVHDMETFTELEEKGWERE